MFERYTEKARRVIFFARYEASQFGSPCIETEHLLLGLLHEDKALTNAVLGAHQGAQHPVDGIRQQIEAHTLRRKPVPTSVDMPLSDEGKRVLAYAAEEAGKLGHQHIGTEHVLLGLLRERRCFAAAILGERGITLDRARERIVQVPSGEPGGVSDRATGAVWSVGRQDATQSRGIIEFRLGDRFIGTAQHPQHPPEIGERVVIAQPLTPGKSDSYVVKNVIYEYAHHPDQPLPTALRLAKIVVELAVPDSAAQDVK